MIVVTVARLLKIINDGTSLRYQQGSIASINYCGPSKGPEIIQGLIQKYNYSLWEVVKNDVLS